MQNFRREKVKVEVWSKDDGTGHFHRNLELVYVLQGKVMIHLAQGKIELNEKDFWIINSNKWHQLETEGRSLFLKIQMDYPMIRDVVGHDEFYFENGSSSEEGRRILKQRLTKFSHRHLNHLSKSPVSFSYLASCYALLDILASYFLVETRQLAREMTKEEKILDYIGSRYNQKITLATLSQHLFLSPTYISKYFKKQFNVNFKEYLTSVRLAHAYEELVNSDYSLTRIAYENGFSNMTQFNKDFKTLYSESPHEIRKAARDRMPDSVQVPQAAVDAFLLKENKKENSELFIETDGQIQEVLEMPWKDMVNFGSAECLLESQYQECAQLLKKKMGFNYSRIWEIFSRKLLIDVDQAEGNYNFTKLNQVFDFFYHEQLLPHIELGPKHLRIDATTRKEVRHQRQKVLFKSQKFMAVFDVFLKHFIHRYGVDFVSKWRFELWLDEDELSADFSISQYFSVFQKIRSIAKKYSSKIQVGGCGYPMNYVKYLPDDFFKHWKDSGTKPDFCSMMVYHYDLHQRDGIHLSSRSQDRRFLAHAVKGFAAKLAEVGWETLPHFVTEWNVSISDRNLLNDSLYKGSCVLQNIFENSTVIDSLAYFIGSDWVSDDVDSSYLLHGGSGLVSKNLFLKPAAWAYHFLHQLDKYKVIQTRNLLLTTNGDGQYTLLVHNNKDLNDLYYSTEEDDLDLTKLNQYVSDLETRTIRLKLNGLASGRYRIKTSSISNQNDIQSIWKAMNYIDDLNLEELEYIRGRSLPEIALSEQAVQDNQLVLDISLPANGFKMAKISHI